MRLLTVSLLAVIACHDESSRPGTPLRTDAGDAAPSDGGPAEDADAEEGGQVGHFTYTRDVGVTSPVCPHFQEPTWGDLYWEAVIPPGGRVEFYVQVAPEPEGLDRARRIFVGQAPDDTPPLYVDDVLAESGRHYPYLRLTAELYWDGDGSPTALSENLLDWVCLDQ